MVYEASIPLTYVGSWSNDKYDESNPGFRARLCQARRPHDEEDLSCDLAMRVEEFEVTVSKALNNFQKVLDPNYILDGTIEEVVRSDEQDEEIPEERQRNKRSLNFIGDAFAWCCGVATQEKVDDYVLKENQLEKKVQELKMGLHEDFKHLSTITKEFEKYDTGIQGSFTEIRKHLKKLAEYESKVQKESSENQTWLTQQLMLVEVGELKRSIQMITFMRKIEILVACKNKNIPLPAVPPPVLSADLQSLTKKLERMGMKPSIPAGQISRYYKLPIADCAMSSKNLTVHVKIPITQLTSGWKLKELITTPFAWHNDTCILMHDHLYLAVSNE